MKKYLLLVTSIIVFAFIDIKSLLIIMIGAFYSYAIFKTKLINKKYGLLSIIPFVLLLIITKIPNSIISIFSYSYLGLKIISFLIDSNRRKIGKANIVDYLLYIFYLPTIFVGPILRYTDFEECLLSPVVNKDNTKEGIYRITLGLIKKIIIANRFSLIIDNVVSSGYEGLYVLVVLLIYVVYLYFDFSGAIDIVNGVSLLLGYRIKENFNNPLFSSSVKEFWSKWHISLSTLLKDYIYIPLGGKRKHKAINVIITFIVSGIWHGLNYVLWGLINGILVIINYKPKNKYWAIILNYLLISISFIFFIYPDITTSLERFISIFSISSFDISLLFEGLNIAELIITIMFVILVLIIEKNSYTFMYKMNDNKFILIYGLTLIVILTLGKYGFGFDGSAFVYSRF